jgi:hypothetical protein
VGDIVKRAWTLLCAVALLSASAVFVVPALSHAQDDHDGHYGAGHSTWHDSFYSKLVRKDTNTSCCNLADCRPTESRMVGDHYEVKVDGVWTPVPKETILHVEAPDGGARVRTAANRRQPRHHLLRGSAA